MGIIPSFLHFVWELGQTGQKGSRTIERIEEHIRNFQVHGTREMEEEVGEEEVQDNN